MTPVGGQGRDGDHARGALAAAAAPAVAQAASEALRHYRVVLYNASRKMRALEVITENASARGDNEGSGMGPL